MKENIKLSSSKKEKCLVLSIKKNKIIKRLGNIRVNNDLLIMKLINNGVLDHSIKRINNKKISDGGCPVLSEEYLDSYNHYIYSLDNFIDYFYDCFNHNVESEYDILWACLKDNNDIFLDKKYVYDNNNIRYYKDAYNKIIVGNFYHNICAFKEELKDDMDSLSISPNKIDINNSNDLENLLNTLVCIYACNRDKHIVLSLFNKVDDSTYKYYLNNFEFMFYSYFNKMIKNNS